MGWTGLVTRRHDRRRGWGWGGDSGGQALLQADIQYVRSRSVGQAKLQTDMTEGADGEVIVMERPWSNVHSKPMRQAFFFYKQT